MMFIETALKNIALNTIMSEIDSSSIYDMYDKAISSYKNAPAGTREDIKKKYQNNKLNLQGSIQNLEESEWSGSSLIFNKKTVVKRDT